MVQDQLVEYITSQIKAGVRPETIKATLVAAGWQSVDVDDTLKKVQGPAVAAGVAAQPMTGAGPKPIATAKAEPQTIRVSDLVSASSSTTSMSASAAKPVDTRAQSAKQFLTPTSSPGATSYQSTTTTTTRSSVSRGPITIEIILGVLMVAFGAVAAYFFFANMGLSNQVATLTAQSTGVSTQVTTLQNQLDASTTALIAQAASATAQSQDLALDLSFYAVPTGVPATPTTTTMLDGTVSGGGTGKLYVITTAYGAKVPVANSKDPKVVSLLQPLVGTNTSVPFGGAYTPGVDSITLTVINGASLIAPPAVATSTASSTVTTTSSSTATTTTNQ